MQADKTSKRNLWLLLIGKWTSELGSGIQEFYLAFYLLSWKKSGLMFALVLALFAIPKIIVSPIIGSIIDYFSKKKLLIILDFCSGMICLFFFGLFSIYEVNTVAIYVFALCLGTISAMFQPTVNAIIPFIVAEKEYIKTNSYGIGISSLIFLMVPLIGAFLYSKVTLQMVFLLNGISFILSAVSECFIVYHERGEQRRFHLEIANFLKEFKIGMQEVKKNQVLLMLILVAVGMNFTFSPVFMVAYPYVLRSVLKVDEWTFSLIHTLMGIGTIIGSLFLVRVVKESRQIRVYGNIILLSGLTIAGLGTGLMMFQKGGLGEKEIIFLSAGLAVLACVGMGVMQVLTNTLMQKNTLKELLGRVFALRSMAAYILLPLGQILIGLVLEYGYFAEAITASAAIIVLLFFKYRKMEKSQKM
ncbi:MAG: MFS transporter [Eubacteriales bacterium]|nr:MFS transporter [Eubacteriales bacterium]